MVDIEVCIVPVLILVGPGRGEGESIETFERLSFMKCPRHISAMLSLQLPYARTYFRRRS